MRALRSPLRHLAWLVLGIEDRLAVLAERHDKPWMQRGVRCKALGGPAMITGARGDHVLVRLPDGRQLEVRPDRLQPR